MNTLEYNGTTYFVGQRVRISNGQPQPPRRFNRKFKAWQSANWIGTVLELRPPGRYAPHGGLTVSNDNYPDTDYMVIRHSLELGGDLAVEDWRDTP